jgi:hypothetical protein
MTRPNSKLSVFIRTDLRLSNDENKPPSFLRQKVEEIMSIDNKQCERYRHAFPEDADRMSLARLSAENRGMTEEFNYLLETALEMGLRANWTYLLAACGGISDHKYDFSLRVLPDSSLSLSRTS